MSDLQQRITRCRSMARHGLAMMLLIVAISCAGVSFTSVAAAQSADCPSFPWNHSGTEWLKLEKAFAPPSFESILNEWCLVISNDGSIRRADPLPSGDFKPEKLFYEKWERLHSFISAGDKPIDHDGNSYYLTFAALKDILGWADELKIFEKCDPPAGDTRNCPLDGEPNEDYLQLRINNGNVTMQHAGNDVQIDLSDPSHRQHLIKPNTMKDVAPDLWGVGACETTGSCSGAQPITDRSQYSSFVTQILHPQLPVSKAFGNLPGEFAQYADDPYGLLPMWRWTDATGSWSDWGGSWYSRAILGAIGGIFDFIVQLMFVVASLLWRVLAELLRITLEANLAPGLMRGANSTFRWVAGVLINSGVIATLMALATIICAFRIWKRGMMTALRELMRTVVPVSLLLVMLWAIDYDVDSIPDALHNEAREVAKRGSPLPQSIASQSELETLYEDYKGVTASGSYFMCLDHLRNATTSDGVLTADEWDCIVEAAASGDSMRTGDNARGTVKNDQIARAGSPLWLYASLIDLSELPAGMMTDVALAFSDPPSSYSSNCDAYEHNLESLYLEVWRIREGWSSGEDLPAEAYLPIVISRMWERAYLMPWAQSQYGSAESAHNARCFWAEKHSDSGSHGETMLVWLSGCEEANDWFDRGAANGSVHAYRMGFAPNDVAPFELKLKGGGSRAWKTCPAQGSPVMDAIDSSLLSPYEILRWGQNVFNPMPNSFEDEADLAFLNFTAFCGVTSYYGISGSSELSPPISANTNKQAALEEKATNTKNSDFTRGYQLTDSDGNPLFYSETTWVANGAVGMTQDKDVDKDKAMSGEACAAWFTGTGGDDKGGGDILGSRGWEPPTSVGSRAQAGDGKDYPNQIVEIVDASGNIDCDNARRHEQHFTLNQTPNSPNPSGDVQRVANDVCTFSGTNYTHRMLFALITLVSAAGFFVTLLGLSVGVVASQLLLGIVILFLPLILVIAAIPARAARSILPQVIRGTVFTLLASSVFLLIMSLMILLIDILTDAIYYTTPPGTVIRVIFIAALPFFVRKVVGAATKKFGFDITSLKGAIKTTSGAAAAGMQGSNDLGLRRAMYAPARLNRMAMLPNHLGLASRGARAGASAAKAGGGVMRGAAAIGSAGSKGAQMGASMSGGGRLRPGVRDAAVAREKSLARSLSNGKGKPSGKGKPVGKQGKSGARGGKPGGPNDPHFDTYAWDGPEEDQRRQRQRQPAPRKGTGQRRVSSDAGVSSGGRRADTGSASAQQVPPVDFTDPGYGRSIPNQPSDSSEAYTSDARSGGAGQAVPSRASDSYADDRDGGYGSYTDDLNADYEQYERSQQQRERYSGQSDDLFSKQQPKRREAPPDAPSEVDAIKEQIKEAQHREREIQEKKKDAKSAHEDLAKSKLTPGKVAKKAAGFIAKRPLAAFALTATVMTGGMLAIPAAALFVAGKMADKLVFKRIREPLMRMGKLGYDKIKDRIDNPNDTFKNRLRSSEEALMAFHEAEYDVDSEIKQLHSMLYAAKNAEGQQAANLGEPYDDRGGLL